MSPVEEDLTMRARSLPRSIEPERDLWPEIEARLDGDAGETATVNSWWRSGAVAAGLMLAASVGFWLGDAQDPPAGQEEFASNVAPMGLISVRQAVEPDLHQTRQDLVAHIYDQLAALPAESRVVVTENLFTINRALDEIDQALKDSPESSLNGRLLMSMYADQLNMLTDMNALIRRSNQEIAL